MTMDQCTHEVRAEYWKKIIKACSQRPAGQSAKKWMDENGICEQSYYHWQRKFRKQAYEQMNENSVVPAVTQNSEISFVELPYHHPVIKEQECEGNIPMESPVAVIRTASVNIAITNEISDSVLSRILKEVSHA